MYLIKLKVHAIICPSTFIFSYSDSLYKIEQDFLDKQYLGIHRGLLGFEGSALGKERQKQSNYNHNLVLDETEIETKSVVI